jgi:hypothetical protein
MKNIRRGALMPKSLVQEALGKDGEELANSQMASGAVKPAPAASPDDDELSKIAAQLDVSIKIVGCGGGWMSQSR